MTLHDALLSDGARVATTRRGGAAVQCAGASGITAAVASGVSPRRRPCRPKCRCSPDVNSWCCAGCSSVCIASACARCWRLVIATAVLLTATVSQARAATGIHKIRHVVIIMQENRSFDEYFGTFPGADGIPMRHGRPTACDPAPSLGHCVRPWHDPHDHDRPQWHDAWSFSDDYDHGRMDGFARVASICSTGRQRAALPRRGGEGVNGLSRSAGNPELLGVRARASCSRITSSSR